jgi:diaminohydroxyphosphoribosylaminopyrimidine deaminase/5-amino-6-(5-phosphoribosylamino)uracil reductase
MVRSAQSDLLVVTTSAAPPERRRILEDRGVKVLICDGPAGRTDLHGAVEYLAQEACLSLMIEAGSKVNWSALESGIVDRIFFYYAPKILGGLQSLPVAGGPGRRTRREAILFRNVTLYPITEDEFAVEACLVKET